MHTHTLNRLNVVVQNIYIAIPNQLIEISYIGTLLMMHVHSLAVIFSSTLQKPKRFDLFFLFLNGNKTFGLSIVCYLLMWYYNLFHGASRRRMHMTYGMVNVCALGNDSNQSPRYFFDFRKLRGLNLVFLNTVNQSHPWPLIAVVFCFVDWKCFVPDANQ